ncbi:hypothetical protein PoMZ_05512 [Pyricularia oryzae]|uniref:Uncharacterized protein n=1 Tax=Pyricularia oryzae TaxID=318829 RepID=A0A4P7NNV1_PYROR|nr:hypothetical protein PoMZ_05512 [Pyricularia oryzae]
MPRPSLALLGHLLAALIDVALDHDAHDGILARLDLFGQLVGDLGLVTVVLERVAMAAVDHEARPEPGLDQSLLGLADALGVIVGALFPAAQDHEAVLVADCAYDGHHARLGHRQEVVGVLNGADSVDGDAQCAVGAVLEADGER